MSDGVEIATHSLTVSCIWLFDSNASGIGVSMVTVVD